VRLIALLGVEHHEERNPLGYPDRELGKILACPWRGSVWVGVGMAGLYLASAGLVRLRAQPSATPAVITGTGRLMEENDGTGSNEETQARDKVDEAKGKAREKVTGPEGEAKAAIKKYEDKLRRFTIMDKVEQAVGKATGSQETQARGKDEEVVTYEEGTKMQEYRMKVAPDTVAYADRENGKLVVEFAIPGARTETVDVKILADSVHLTAPARDIEYVSALALGWPVKPDKAEATYEHGLLRIEVPFKDPMEDAVKVSIKAPGTETKTLSVKA
jgi:HSP20 family protein